jgi:outer membrane lipoprotein-sorting protein
MCRGNHLKRYRLQAIGLILLCMGGVSWGQEIRTAESFFDEVSDRYGKVQDYEASLAITEGDTVMKGKIFYRSPNLLRINFTDPADQVLVTDGEKLTIYIPRYEVIMEQKLKRRSQAALANMASRQGLAILKKNYSVAYLVGPEPVPLAEGSGERVVKLKLTSRYTSEGFRQIVLSVGQDNLIRRISAVTLGYKELTYDFTGITINQNIPENRFRYDAPAYANVYNNFLFNTED